MVFDNSGGGYWSRAIKIKITTPLKEDVQYKIVIDSTNVSVYSMEDVLKTQAAIADDFWANVKSDGSDIRLADQDYSQLYFCIEQWDYANKSATIVVRIPAGTIELVLAYGNPHATKSSYENPSKTYELYDHFDKPFYVAPKIVKDTTTHDFHSILVRQGKKVLLFTRRGTDHYAGGAIYMAEYDIDTDTWSDYVKIYEDPNYDCRNVAGGKVGDRIVIFLAKYDPANDKFIDIGFIYSDYGGKTWSDFISLKHLVLPGITKFSAYGQIVEVYGTYYQIFYGLNDDDTYRAIWLVKSTDGIHWELGSIIHAGTERLGETALVHIGNGKLIALSRIEDGGYLKQWVSNDGGKTWNGPYDTNLGISSGIKMAAMAYDEDYNKVLVVYCDRGEGYVKISYGDADKVFSDPQAWLPVIKVLSAELGYPAIVRIDDYDNRYLWVASTGSPTTTDADIYYGIISAKLTVHGALTISISNSVLTISGQSSKTPPDNILSGKKFGTDIAVEALINVDYSAENFFGIQLAEDYEGYKYDSATSTYSKNVAGIMDTNATDDTFSFITTDGTSRNLNTPGSYTGGWQTLIIKRKASEVYFKLGNYEWTSTQNLPSGDLYLLIGGYATDLTSTKAFNGSVDLIKVYKIKDPAEFDTPRLIKGSKIALEITTL